MAIRPLRIASFCAGYGGLDLGVHLACPAARTVLYVEREAYAAAILAARLGDGTLDDAPIWSDLGTFDGGPWRGVVDCVIAGLPCQPYSVAGKRRGDDDERAIWPTFIRVLEQMRPAMVFIENVPAFVKYFRPVGDALSELGYRIEAGLFSAAEVGGSHRRQRFFVLAYAAPERRGTSEHDLLEWQPDLDGHGDDLAAARCKRDEAHESDVECSGAAVTRAAGRVMADPIGSGCERPWLSGWHACAGTTVEGVGADVGNREPYRVFAPGPSDRAAWSSAAPGFEPAIRRVADGPTGRLDRSASASRIDQLRALGNGVVPLTAALAWQTLMKRVVLAETVRPDGSMVIYEPFSGSGGVPDGR